MGTVRQKKVTRGLLARESGVNPETIRYYEKIGLLPEPRRSEGGHRIYSDSDQQRLYFIRRCREMGFTLEEVRELLTLVDRQQASCERVQGIAMAHAASIGRKIDDLMRMQKTLQELADRCSGEQVPDCPVIEALMQT